MVTGYLAAGLAIGVPFGVAVSWRTGMWWRGLMGGLLVGMAGSLLIGPTHTLAAGIRFGLGNAKEGVRGGGY